MTRNLLTSSLLVLAAGSLALAGDRAVADRAAATSPDPVPAALGGFIENLGQWDSPARFGIPGSAGACGIDVDGLSLWLVEAPGRDGDPSDSPGALRGVQVRLEWRGASPERRLEGLDRLPGIRNYFAGSDPARWRTRVPAYARVAQRGIYEGIDLIVREVGDRRVAYDLFLAPGADPSAIEIDVLGADGVVLRADGALVIATPLGEVVQSAPRTWQTSPDGTPRPVECRFEVRTGSRFGFTVHSPLDPDLALVIDPTIDTFTYLGGSGHDSINAIRIGSGDEPILAGHTQARDVVIPFPTTPGTFLDTMPAVGTLAFVTRLSSDAQSLVYSTFLGAPGTNQDVSSVTCAEVHPATQEVSVVGQTSHPDYPTTPGAFDETFGPVFPFFYYESVFATRLSSDGAALLYSTFLGTDLDDRPAGMVLHDDGRLTIFGTTWSAAFPTTPGSFMPQFPGGNRATFLFQLAPDGSAPVFSTFFGGSGGDDAKAIALASDGTFFLAGDTTSVDFPVTPGTYDTTIVAGAGQENFILRTSATGDSVIVSTFFTPLSLTSMILDPQDRPLIAGRAGPGFPLTANAYTQNPAPDGNVVVGRLDAALTQIEYGTMVGGSLGGWGTDTATALALHPSGTILVAGTTSSSDFPVTPDAFQTTYSSSNDVGCFLWIDPEQSGPGSLLYSTYLDGSGPVEPKAIAIDSRDRVLLGGSTWADDLAVTPDAFQGVILGCCDAILARFRLSDAGMFRRGDANADGGMNVADAVALLAALFSGGSIPCDDAADANDDGALDVADAVSLLGALFVPGSNPPPAPGPASCGADPTGDALDCAGASGCP